MNKFKNNKGSRAPKHIINEFIRYDKVRLSHNGESNITSMKEVREMAIKEGLDIMVVTEQANPPVVKLCKYEKFVYDEKKKLAEQRKLSNKKNKEVKEIRLSPTISDNDLEVKKKKIAEFIDKGHKVKIDMQFKGRMIVHSDVGNRLLLSLIIDMEDILKADALPKMTGRNIIVILSPKK